MTSVVDSDVNSTEESDWQDAGSSGAEVLLAGCSPDLGASGPGSPGPSAVSLGACATGVAWLEEVLVCFLGLEGWASSGGWPEEVTKDCGRCWLEEPPRVGSRPWGWPEVVCEELPGTGLLGPGGLVGGSAGEWVEESVGGLGLGSEAPPSSPAGRSGWRLGEFTRPSGPGSRLLGLQRDGRRGEAGWAPRPRGAGGKAAGGQGRAPSSAGTRGACRSGLGVRTLSSKSGGGAHERPAAGQGLQDWFPRAQEREADSEGVQPHGGQTEAGQGRGMQRAGAQTDRAWDRPTPPPPEGTHRPGLFPLPRPGLARRGLSRRRPPPRGALGRVAARRGDTARAPRSRARASCRTTGRRTAGRGGVSAHAPGASPIGRRPAGLRQTPQGRELFPQRGGWVSPSHPQPPGHLPAPRSPQSRARPRGAHLARVVEREPGQE